ncbi:zinc ribbon domain-containing protein [Enterococcus faecalis]|uniref:Putative zinc ribbon domain-containing protein n=1 Tax=Enterococcus faecalis RP2S-4 TaxID=1244145 RepID=A0ABC9TM06_ENTFL|nr:zinc ribbon domain-containing protein [Enterococcus faecalis]EPI09084.1 hypothetical protein D358_01299 [Enterococcus faecalis RP2S-4]
MLDIGKLCQSCGMPLYLDEAENKEQSNYCSKCYKDGKWMSDESFEEMYQINLKKINHSSMNDFQKYFLNKIYTKEFMRSLERWKKE